MCFLVEVEGFEPPTLWSQTRCANRTALHLEKLHYLDFDHKYKSFFLLHNQIFKIILK